MPLPPWLEFVYMHVLRRGFLDGVPGLTYCTLLPIHEFPICLKIEELRRQEGMFALRRSGTGGNQRPQESAVRSAPLIAPSAPISPDLLS